MKLRDVIAIAWLGLGVSLLLITWQVVAYLTDNIPDHILPLVRLLSGTQESVPVAYSWSLRIREFSVMMLLGSLAALLGAYSLLFYHRADKSQQP